MNSSKEDDLPSLFRLARNVSKLSSYKVKMGAVLVNRRPIAVGNNSMKSHPRWNYLNKQTIHAEANTIACALSTSGERSIKGSTMFIYREKKNGYPAMARPCVNCLKLLKKYDILAYYIN